MPPKRPLSVSWGSPLDKPTTGKKAPPPPDPLKELKKLQAKPRIRKSGARTILGEKKGVDDLRAYWVENWIENLVQNNCYPPQLISDDFVAKLGELFDPEKAHQILTDLRTEFKKRFSWEKPTDYDFLVTAMKADPQANLFFSPSLDFLREW